MQRIKKAGFTLVELLVVIGIIALLISVLMPALGRARSAANLLACQSNFRQVYTAIALYSNDYKGLMPTAASQVGDWGPSGTNAHIYVVLSRYLGRKIDNKQPGETENNLELPTVFRCTEAPRPDGGITWNSTVYRTMVFHPRGFPGSDCMASGSAASTWGSIERWPQRKLASVKRSPEKAAFWDGGIVITWNMCPLPTLINLDGWRWGNGGFGHGYQDPPMNDNGGNESKRFDDPVDTGANRDASGWFDGSATVRFRHMRNTVTPVCFFDGHVEARKLKELKVREICISPVGVQ
jgi:prepilin-type N-terminal cleavage/methylation domain-containing protein/prepilin-type processing-associated H-X9-DG protein